jgi:hypothetical protein
MYASISQNCFISGEITCSRLTCWFSSSRSNLQPATITGTLTCWWSYNIYLCQAYIQQCFLPLQEKERFKPVIGEDEGATKLIDFEMSEGDHMHKWGQLSQPSLGLDQLYQYPQYYNNNNNNNIQIRVNNKHFLSNSIIDKNTDK